MDVGGILRRRKRTILTGLAAVVAAVAVFTLLMERTYESSVTVMVEHPGQQEGGSGLEVLGQVGRARSMETEIELIQSRRVSESAAGAGVHGRVSAAPVQPDADLIQITCEAPEPREAQRLCQKTSAAYLRLRTELQRSQASSTATVLEDQVKQVGERLREAEGSLGQYMARNQAVALDQQAGAEVQMFSQLRSRRDQLEAERAALATLIRQTGNKGTRSYRDLASFPTFVGTQNQVISGLIANLITLENQRSELAVTRTERNPDMMAIDQRISEIETQLRGFALSYEDALQAQIGSLNGTIGSSAGQLSAIPAKQVETGRLQRQVTVLDNLYNFLTARLHEAEVASMVSLPSVRIVDSAAMPEKPVRPNVPLNLGLGVLLGLAFGLLLALYREHTDSSLRERKEVERETGIPVLGMIPAMRKPGPILRAAMPGAGGNGAPRLGLGQSGGRSPVVRSVKRSWEEEIVLEAFRSLAADLRFSREDFDGGGLRSVAVTSSGRGEGKTFTACNLAIAQASHGTSTLLVDADLRASGVARFFELPWSSPGLTDVLTDQVELNAVLKEIKMPGTVPLQVMTSGRPNGGAGGVLDRYAGELDQVLSKANTQFDLVVVDTPPLNVLTDAATIASRVDAVIVVVRGGVTDRSGLELTLERLGRANAHVVGIVLNDVDLPEYYVSYSQDFTAGRPTA